MPQGTPLVVSDDPDACRVDYCGLYIFFDLILVVYYIRKILFSLDNGASSTRSEVKPYGYRPPGGGYFQKSLFI